MGDTTIAADANNSRSNENNTALNVESSAATGSVEEGSSSVTDTKPTVSFEEKIKADGESTSTAKKQQRTNSQTGTARTDEGDDDEWIRPSKDAIELNARKARLGSRRVTASVLASSMKPAYFDDRPRRELTDEELMIVDLDAEEENQRYCHYFKTKSQFVSTVVLGSLFVLAVILMGIFIPRYLDCSYGCVNSIERLKDCFANGKTETLPICPGTYSVYAPLQIYSGRQATIECLSTTPEEKCIFDAPSENNNYIINFGEGHVTFKSIVFTSSVDDGTGLALFSPSFFAGYSTINFEYCSFVNSPQGFAVNSKSSTFKNCLISNNGVTTNSGEYDSSSTALDFGPSLLFGSGLVQFQSSVFEDNNCGNIVNVGRSDGGPNSTPVTFQNSTFRNNRADYVFNIGGAGLKGSGIILKDILVANNTVSTSIFRQNQREAPLTINGTSFDNNQGPVLSIRNANYVTLVDTTITNNVNFVEDEGVIDPLIHINGATDITLSGVTIEGNDGIDTINPSNDDASILYINNAGRNNTIGTVTMTQCTVQNNNATASIVSIQGQTGLALGRCLNEGTMMIENSFFEGNIVNNPTNVQSVLQLACANSITVKSSMFTSNVQVVTPPPGENSTTATTTYQPLVHVSTPSRKDSLIDGCIFDSNDWSNVAALIDADSGIVVPSGGGVIQNTCFNSGTYRGTVNAASVAAFPYEPRMIHLSTIRNTNFYGTDNTFVSATTPCQGALYGFAEGGASSCANFNANTCPVATESS